MTPRETKGGVIRGSLRGDVRLEGSSGARVLFNRRREWPQVYKTGGADGPYTGEEIARAGLRSADILDGQT